jgi:Ca-activated chloride channel family protein
MSGHGDRVLDRIPIEVEGIEVDLEAPPRVTAGTRFEVRWRGPDNSGDFIAIAEPDAGRGRHIDFGFTSLGSPISLAAPFTQGSYEIRYVSGVDGSILARVPLAVD